MTNLVQGYFGHEEIIAESQRLFKQYLTDPQSIHSDMRQMVLNISILNGSKDDFEALLQRFPKADSAEEGKHILEALGNVQDEALLRQYLVRYIYNRKSIELCLTSFRHSFLLLEMFEIKIWLPDLSPRLTLLWV
jgi:hypothetical protein